MLSNRERLAEILYKYLAREDRSHTWLAKQLGVHPGTVVRWADAQTYPRDPDHFRAMVDLLHIDEEPDRDFMIGGGVVQARRVYPHIVKVAEDIDVNEVVSVQEVVSRSIYFPPEYKQSGIAILGYFGHIVESKYPDIDVGVTIEQKGTKVAVIVTTPMGDKERIEKELDNFGLAVMGRLPLEEYLHDPLEVLGLKNKLEIATLELRQTRELMHVERQLYGARISDLEQHVRFIGSLLLEDRSANAELVKAISELSQQASVTTQGSFDTILEILERGITPEDKQAILIALQNVQKRDEPLFVKLTKTLTMGAIQGTAGNYLYAWLTSLSLKLP